MRIFLALLLATGLWGCGREPGRAGSTGDPAAGPAATPPPDARAGDSGLALVSRHVFAEMNRRGPECQSGQPVAVDVSYTLEVVVAGGRVVEARLADASVGRGGDRTPVPRDLWPPRLVAQIACLAPHLKNLALEPSLPDGTYPTQFVMRASEPTPSAARPDPHEAGLPDLTRVARYLFREMQRRGTVCRSDNPYADTLVYRLRVSVVGSRFADVELAGARLTVGERSTTIGPGEWPDSLRSYVACLRPFLQELEMSPAPSDGVYEPEYGLPGTR